MSTIKLPISIYKYKYKYIYINKSYLFNIGLLLLLIMAMAINPFGYGASFCDLLQIHQRNAFFTKRINEIVSVRRNRNFEASSNSVYICNLYCV